MARKLAQIGASVTASGDREFIYYTLEVNIVQVFNLIVAHFHKAHFQQWNIFYSCKYDENIDHKHSYL